MVRRNTLLLFLAVLLLMTFPDHTEGYEKEYEVDIHIYINGREASHQGKIIDGTYYSPARLLEHNFDVELKWVGILKLLQFDLEGREFRMREGDHHLQIDHRVHHITPPIIIDGSMWIPLEEILSPLGYRASFDAQEEILHIAMDTSTIKDIDFNAGEQSLVITSDQPFKYDMEDGDDGLRLTLYQVTIDEQLQIQEELGFLQKKDRDPDYILELLDLPEPQSVVEEEEEHTYALTLKFPSRLVEADYREEEQHLILHTAGPVDDLEALQGDGLEDLVVDLPKILMVQDSPVDEFGEVEAGGDETLANFLIKQIESGQDYTIQKRDEESVLISWGDGTYIRDIEWLNDEGNRGLLITSNRPLIPETFTLPDPPRMVLDFPGSSLQEEHLSLPVEDGPVQQVRMSQFDHNTVRVVLDLDYIPRYYVDHWQDDQYRTHIGFQRQLLSISQHTGEHRDHFTIELSGETSYKVQYLSSPHRLVVDIEDTVIGLDENNLPAGGSLEGTRVSQLSRNPDIVRVVFEMDSNPQYEVLSPRDTDHIAFRINRNPLVGKVIAIDPGHGGMDPGAVGPRGSYEKDVVLDISLLLYDKLREAGARPVLTRSDDEFISLRGRADIANRAQADAFISIHANAVIRDIPEGTETYITPHHSSLDLLLANLVHREVVDTIGLRDRGVKQQNLGVLLPLRMPGVLLEVAFISNPMEERLLMDSEFQEKVAQGIVQGFINYFAQASREGL